MTRTDLQSLALVPPFSGNDDFEQSAKALVRTPYKTFPEELENYQRFLYNGSSWYSKYYL